jgi:raffinose/stachyose/melibiose transport system substrate-binding protein
VSIHRRARIALPVVAASLALVASGCSVSSIGSGSDDSGAKTTITYLYGNDAASATLNQALIKAFEAKNPDVHVKSDTRPGGTDGDNIVKTRLSTGEMADVFNYNSGSLFQALNPDDKLAPLGDEPWVKKLVDPFPAQVRTDKGLYGAPLGSSQAGGVVYNRKVYEKLKLTVPTDWSQFVANSRKIEKAGITPIEQSYGETWTSQLFVLGDFGNVAAQDPDWAKQYTAHQRKYADQPALQGFSNQEQMHKLGFFNKDFASATFENGVAAVATGEAAQYPMLTSAVSTVKQNNPENVNDVGVFALPAQKAADTRLTVWMPNALYIPKTTTGDKLAAAKKFIQFVESADGCKIQTEKSEIAGPFSNSVCQLPADVPQIVKDVQSYYDKDKTYPALEFLSPIKGPNLEKITVEVGSGIRSAEDGAALYDKDVEKQAQQLGLPGW